MHLVCPSCGAKNRVAADKLDQDVRCGRCRHDLMAPEPVALSDAQLAALLDKGQLEEVKEVKS